jgi:hypothetical protein
VNITQYWKLRYVIEGMVGRTGLRCVGVDNALTPQR